MVRNKLKKFLLIWPIVLLFGVWWNVSYQQHQIDKKLLAADGLIWSPGEQQVEVRVTQSEDGELRNIKISVVNSEMKEIYRKTEIIDRDMFGGGFVRAIQVDQDSDNEIVIWHARAKYYLDFSEGYVKEMPYDGLSQEVRALAESWRTYNVMAPLRMTICLIFLFCYYFLYILVVGISRLYRGRKNRTA